MKIALITGKGGVGKSTVSAAYAMAEAKRGQKVLLVELGPKSLFQFIFHQQVSYHPRPMSENLHVAIWDGETCLREYLQHFVKIEKIVDLFFDNKVMKSFVKAAPALRELAIMGKLTSAIREWGPPLEYDLVVLDSFATGHFWAMMEAPRGMAELIQFGPMGEQSRKIDEVLRNSDHCRYLLVSIPELLPTTETIELRDRLRADFQVEVKLALNRWLPQQFSEKELNSINGPGQDFAHYLSCIYRRQQESEKRLHDAQVNAHKLELILEKNSSQVIGTLSESMESLWKSS